MKNCRITSRAKISAITKIHNMEKLDLRDYISFMPDEELVELAKAQEAGAILQSTIYRTGKISVSIHTPAR